MGGERDLVGLSLEGDRLDPNRIAQDLPEGTPLRTILSSSAVTTLHRLRAEASANAQRMQRQHRRLNNSVVIGGAIAAMTSALLLTETHAPASATAAEAWLRSFAKSAHVEIVVAQMIGLVLSAFATSMLATMRYGESWTDERGKAEDGRIRLVETVLAQGKAAGPDAFAQAFEFFRRYQLELQLAYQAKRLARLNVTRERSAYVIAILTAVAAIGGAIGAVSAAWAIVGAFLGIAVPVLLSAAKSFSRIDGNGGLDATRAAKGLLERDVGRLDDIRGSLRDGDFAAVDAFISEIHGILRVESGAWAGRMKVEAAKPADS